MESNTLTRTGVFYLFLSVSLALFLHNEFLPGWTLMLAAVIMAWRYSIFRGIIKKPNFLIKLILVISGFYGVYYTYGFALTIESSVTLLVASLALKPLEIQTKRDSYVLLFLCILVQGQHFLFEQGPLAYLFVLVCFASTLIALVVVNQSSEGRSQIKMASKIFLLSLPLTVFLFFVLPRLAPLWSLNMSTKAGLVGLSSSMSPGDISELGRSDELAFRVKFESIAPPINQLYWRALVLDSYDGEKWEAFHLPSVVWPQNVVEISGSDTEANYTYEIMSEAHEQTWLFSLQGSKPLQVDIGIKGNGLLINKHKVMFKFQYRVEAPLSKPTNFVELKGIQASLLPGTSDRLTALQRQSYLQLPKNLNQRTKDFALNLRGQVANDLGFIKVLSDYYLSNEFFYTLSPGEARSDDRVDEFLFDRRVGFCAHYAGSTVYLLRSAGIPSRVVLGYLGGEKNPMGDYYSVYQYDAHAWVEVWLEGIGWLRIDPTGWVSPERVEQGIEQAIKQEFVGFTTQFEWLNNMRHQLHAFSYVWNDLMLNYKGDPQHSVLNSMFGSRDSLTWGLIISTIMFLVVALVFAVVIFGGPRSVRSEHGLLLDNYIQRLNKMGINVSNSMSFLEIEKAVSACYPQSTYALSLMTSLLNQTLYRQESSHLSKQTKREYKKLLYRVLDSCK
ncbi:MAG: transglutaminase-like putative cysteine protease [Bermanella sp.]|jgi:transglutaminase-like putative cysteine protease